MFDGSKSEYEESAFDLDMLRDTTPEDADIAVRSYMDVAQPAAGTLTDTEMHAQGTASCRTLRISRPAKPGRDCIILGLRPPIPQTALAFQQRRHRAIGRARTMTGTDLARQRTEVTVQAQQNGADINSLHFGWLE